MANDSALDVLFILLFLLAFLAFPFLLIFSILSCVACARTSAWKKEQRHLRRLQSDPDSLPLVEPESRTSEDHEEDDFLDTEDEEDFKAAKAEDLADSKLTTGQKFRKELRKAWSGDRAGEERKKKEKEREERRKVAKAVAREVERLERRRERMARRNGGEGASSSSAVMEEGLPKYEVAVAGDVKSERDEL